MSKLFTPLTLPNGQVLPNRLGKAAMEENLCDEGQQPGQGLCNLYRRWASGGAGLILTGNVMVAPDTMTGPGGVYLGAETLDDPDVAECFKLWAAAGKSGGGKFYMQISHPGRQVFASLSSDPVSASATQVGSMMGISFKPARALSHEEILAMIQRYADTAAAAEKSGFDGVQIHGAHGYLITQFLSPLTNLRQDQWGGALENRARFLLEIMDAVRARVRPDFGVAVKLNSADFQRGGFEARDAKQVVAWLNDKAVDFVELSGGNYESLALLGDRADDSAEKNLAATANSQLSNSELRELYFFDFAKEISEIARMPLMLTGGVTKLVSAKAAVSDGAIELIGLGRSIGLNPDLPNDWKAGRNQDSSLPRTVFKDPKVRGFAQMAMTKSQMNRLANGKAPSRQFSIPALLSVQLIQSSQTRRYKRWLAQR